MSQSAGGHIVLGVTGSIAAYKAASVLRGLMDRGHAVRVVMTRAACHLVGPSTFRSLSGRRVVTRLFVEQHQVGLEHIELAEWAEVLAVVPATANFIGKAANGIADDALTCTWMACDCPKLVAPAMNDRMWASPAVRRNCGYLRGLEDVHFVEPVEGRLASGKRAMGHLAPVAQIVERLHALTEGGPDGG